MIIAKLLLDWFDFELAMRYLNREIYSYPTLNDWL